MLAIFSRMGFLCGGAFIIFSVINRFIFPFGDEPDFEYRSTGLLDGDYPGWAPYHLLSPLLQNIQLTNTCVVDASPFSLWATIAQQCQEDFYQIISRITITVAICAPLIFLIIFRRFLVFSGMLKGKSSIVINQRLDAIGLTLLLPGVLYALGFLATEQLVVVLSLLSLIFFENLVVCIGLVWAVYSLDSGNAIVVLFALLQARVNMLILKKFGLRWVNLAILAQVVGAFFAGIVFLEFVASNGLFVEKAQAISDSVSISEEATKYPVLLRPVVTFMTAVFMTAGFIKIVPLYIIFAYFIFDMWRKARKDLFLPDSIPIKDFQESKILCLTAIQVILTFVFLIPTYSNAKYYIFLIPFIVQYALNFYRRAAVFVLFSLSSLIVCLGMSIFHLHF